MSIISLPIITFFCAFLENHYLVFLGLILSIQELQYEDNLFRQFCNPSFDRDNNNNKVVSIKKRIEFGAIW